MQAPKPTSQLVWTLPIRIFHWLFAASLSLALGIGFLAGEHSSLFKWHIYFGLLAGFLLIVRIILGCTTRGPASLSSLLSAPFEIASHLKNYLHGKPPRYAGHNPLASSVYIALFVFLGLSLITGFNMQSEFAEETHEAFATLIALLIAAHLVGIALHSLLFRENISLSMIDGKKALQVPPPERTSRPILGGLVFVIFATFAVQLFQNFRANNESVTLPWLGAELSLHENESSERHAEEGHRKHHEDHDD